MTTSLIALPIHRVAIQFDDRQMVAWVDLAPGEYIPLEVLRAAVAASGIRFGLLMDAMREVIVPEPAPRRIFLARGQEREDGEDARLEHLVQRGNPYKVRNDGSLDFQGANLLITVKKDQPLARITDPGDGRIGMTVLGTPVQPQPGKPLSGYMKSGDGTLFDEASQQIVAERTGIYNKKKNDDVEVEELLIVDGDVDFHSGSINSDQPVLIKGDVKAGFSVRSRGNVAVLGCVEDSDIEVAGDLEVQRGILSGQCPVKVGGMLRASHIEEREVHAYNIYVQQGLRRVQAFARKDIVTQGIVGGSVHAGGNIEVRDIGSEFGEPTICQAAYDLVLHTQKNKLLQEISTLQKEINETEDELKAQQEQCDELSRKARKAAEAKAPAVVLNKAVTLAKNALLEREQTQNVLSDYQISLRETESNPLVEKDLEASVQHSSIVVRGAAHLGSEIKFGSFLTRPVLMTIDQSTFEVVGKEIVVRLEE